MVTNILLLYSLVALLWWFFAWLYYDYRIDLLRFKLFKLRDKLFSFAENKKISFDDPAYIMTRTFLNGSLRFAHRLTITELLLTPWIQKKYNPTSTGKFHEKWHQATKKLTLEQKKELLSIHAEMHIAIISHVIMICPLLYPLAIIIKIAIKLHWLHMHSISKKTRTRFNTIDAAIYDMGTVMPV